MRFILFCFLSFSLVLPSVAQNFSQFTNSNAPFQSLGNEHIIEVIQLGNGAKRALPKALPAQGLGLLDSVQFTFYGLKLFNTENGRQNTLSVDAFAYAESQDFPAKTVIYKQKFEGDQGKEILQLQFEILFDEIPDTMVYQYIINYEWPSISMHYGKDPLRDKVDSIVAGIFAEDAFGDTPFFYLLQGSPSEPELYTNLTQPYYYLNNAPSENILYTFSNQGNGIGDHSASRFFVQNTENGLRINSHGELSAAQLFNLQGQKLADAKLIGDFLFFTQTKTLTTGVYPIHIKFKDGREGVIKHWQK